MVDVQFLMLLLQPCTHLTRQGVAATIADQPLDHPLGVDQAEAFH